MDVSERVVYLDVLFFNNLFFDSLLLFATAKILKKNLRLPRLLLSASAGALYASVCFFPALSVLSAGAFQLLSCAVMHLIAFGKMKGGALFKTVCVFYGLSFALYGGISACFFLTPAAGRMDFSARNGVFYIRLPWGYLLLFTAVSLLVVYHSHVLSYVCQRIERFLLNTKISLGEKEIVVKGYLDTGNHLKNPLSQKGVPVLKAAAAKALFPPAVYEAARNLKSDDTDKLLAFAKALEDEGLGEKFTPIPFESLGRRAGLLAGVSMDRMEVVFKDKTMIQSDVCVAIAPEGFSRRGDYELLLPAEIIENME